MTFCKTVRESAPESAQSMLQDKNIKFHKSQISRSKKIEEVRKFTHSKRRSSKEKDGGEITNKEEEKKLKLFGVKKNSVGQPRLLS